MNLPGGTLTKEGADRLTAVVDLVGRSGAQEFQLRYDDDPEPTVWVADCKYKDGREAAGALDPVTAALRLAELLVDGGTCLSCSRPTALEVDFTARLPLQDTFCWYVYDPELQKFRRSCEGDEDRYRGVGRNDPCPCGSGEKLKRCHGSR